MKHLIIEDKAGYIEKQLKDKSVSIEMRMILDDGKTVSPFIKMFKIDDFRSMEWDEIEEIISGNTRHIARTFSLAILNRSDCLAGNRPEKPEEV
jgi:hypothetical protein